MRIKPVLAMVLLVLFAIVLELTPAHADPEDMGPHPNYFFEPAGASKGDNWKQESTSADPLAYVPIIAVIAIVAFLLYFARREDKI